jgi:hypothetical protein
MTFGILHIHTKSVWANLICYVQWSNFNPYFMLSPITFYQVSQKKTDCKELIHAIKERSH